MVLAFKARTSTKGVDAIFHPPQIIRELSRAIQQEQELPEDWINDGAKGFVSAKHDVVTSDLPQFENLRLTAPTPEYLLAMKCMASRIASAEGDRDDVSDIKFLIRHLGLKSVAQVMDVVAKYYPQAQIPVRAQFLVEDIFARYEK